MKSGTKPIKMTNIGTRKWSTLGYRPFVGWFLWADDNVSWAGSTFAGPYALRRWFDVGAFGHVRSGLVDKALLPVAAGVR